MKKLLVLMILLGLLGNGLPLLAQINPNPDSSQIFADVIAENSYAEALKYLKEQNLVSGYPDGTFRPYQTINRAEFTKIIVGAATGYNLSQDPSDYDIYALVGVPFSDAEHGEWYVPYLRKAKALAMIDGYPDGTFKPAAEINFAEAAKIIVNGLGAPVETTVGAEWYKFFVEYLAEQHAIPLTINSFDQKITRGEMAEMIFRLKTNDTGRPSLLYSDLDCAKGYIEGSVGYPSEGIPTGILICANKVDSVDSYCTYNKINDQKYVYGIGYKLAVPEGTYEITGLYNGMTGLYSEFVTCGMDVNNCQSHALVKVPVEAGQTVKDIDLVDWYAPDINQ